MTCDCWLCGVFQGCPLSPVLFNICFQLLLDSLAAPELSCLSYDFKSAPLQVSQTSFADDVGLYSKSSAGCQKLIAVTEGFLSWTQCMQAAPHKCKSSAAKLVDGRYKPYNPCLTMSGRKIAFIEPKSSSFWGEGCMLIALTRPNEKTSVNSLYLSCKK